MIVINEGLKENQLHELEIPKWIKDDLLQFPRPYYHLKRINDFDKFKLQVDSPAPFKRRNTYFDLDSIVRV